MIWTLRRRAGHRAGAMQARATPLTGGHAGTAHAIGDNGAVPRPFALTVAKPQASVWVAGAATAPDGSFWIAGTIAVHEREPSHGYLAKVTPDGRLDSEYRVEIPGAVTAFRSLTLLEDGTIAAAASLTRTHPSSPRHDGAILTFDADCAVTGQTLLSDLGIDNGWLSHVAPHANGDLALTGSARDSNDHIGALALRVDRSLEVLWLQTERPRETGTFLYGHASAALPDGSTVAIGTAQGGALAHPRAHGWLARFDRDGAKQWRQWLTARSPFAENCDWVNGYWVDVLPNGNAVYLQDWDDERGERTSGVLMEIDAAGSIARQTPLNIAENSDLHRFRVMRNGDVIVAGSFQARHPVIARIAPSGSVLWTVELKDLYESEVGAIVEDALGAVIIPVSAPRRKVGSTAGWVVRLGPDGSRA